MSLPVQPARHLAGPTLSRRLLLGISAAVLLSLYLLVSFSISEVTPFNKGPDEGINLRYVEFIAHHGRLPITYVERDQVGPKANWPALYHLLVAWLSRSLEIDLAGPPYIKIFWDSFRYRAIDVQSEDSWYLLTEDQARPYYGRILVIHLGRWLTILFSITTLLIVYVTLSEVLPDKPWLALAGTAFLAFTPTFIFIGSVLNEDALVAMLTALYFWMLVKIIKNPASWWPYWVMGIALGLSVTAKYTTVVLPLEVILVLLVLARRQGYSWRWWLPRLVVVGGSAVLASSWWFGWNFWFLNEVDELGWGAGLLRPIFTGGTDVTLARLGNFFSGGQIGLAELPENVQVGTFPEWVTWTFRSFWGVTIGGAIPASLYVYPVIGLLLGLAGWGVWRLWRSDYGSRWWLSLFVFHTMLFLVAPLVRFGLSRRLGQTAQGRHILIPAAIAVVALLIWGLARAIPPRWQPWSFSLIIASLIGWSGLHLYRLDNFQAPLLPLRTYPGVWTSHPIEAQFGEAIKLVGYEVVPRPAESALQLTLAWQTLSLLNENYLLQVTLLDEAGQVASHWTGYNGQGRVPTLAWEPGDTVFDRISLPLPNLPAGNYTVQVQISGRAGPLPVNSDPAQPGTLALTQVSLSASANFAYPYSLNFAGPGEANQMAFTLWPAPETGQTLSVYRYPATISVVTSPGNFKINLVDPAGQAWPAIHSQANIHTFVIGPRWPSGEYRLQATSPTGDETQDQLTSEPVLRVENWWQRRFDRPEIAVPSEANFANQLSLLGYTLPYNQVKAGEALPITLYWQAPAEMSPQADFIQFNQLLDSQGTLRGGYDRQPLEYYSTMLWAPGEVVVDGYAVPVEADAPPGVYYLNVGYYLVVGESAVNLPLVVDGNMTEVHSVTIGPIQVIAP